MACLFTGEALGRYGFPGGHPFGPDRLEAFMVEARRRGLDQKASLCDPERASPAVLERFHEPGYIERVQHLSTQGTGSLDLGDTPAFPGVYEAAATVVGSVVKAVASAMDGRFPRCLVPIAGLHHARRDRAAGFCVFNDCGVALETLKTEYGLERIAYVDIDAHHGDGVYYAFEDDPAIWTADIHQDGGTLFPGTGAAEEEGTGPARGTKLNIPLEPGAGPAVFQEAWTRVEAHLGRARPQIILLQCGADSLAGDPLTQLELQPHSHHYAASRLVSIAQGLGHGRVVALGGGGYNRTNLGQGWCAVLEALLEGEASGGPA